MVVPVWLEKLGCGCVDQGVAEMEDCCCGDPVAVFTCTEAGELRAFTGIQCALRATDSVCCTRDTL